MADRQIVVVNPLIEHMRYLLESRFLGRHLTYDKRLWESVYLVDTDGSLYGYSEAFDKDFCYGSVLDSPLASLLQSPGYTKTVAAAEQCFNNTCTSCPFLGKGCTGCPVAEGGQEYNDYDDSGAIACTATRGLLEHLSKRFEEAGIFESTKARDLLEMLPAESAEIAI